MNRYTYNLSCLENEDNISFYLLGAFITDGNVQILKTKTGRIHGKKVSISSKDKDWLESIRDYICKELPISLDRESYRLNIYSTAIGEWLILNNCIPNKSLTVKMPIVPDKYFADFIRGCIDGDGSISSSKYKKVKNNKIYEYNSTCVYLCGSSLLFLESIKNKLLSLGFKGSLYSVKNKNPNISGRKIQDINPHYRLCFNGKTAKSLLNYLYYADHKLSMMRKLDYTKLILQS